MTVHVAEVYPEASLLRRPVGRWRYRVRSSNGETLAASQSYTRRYSAIRAALRNHPDVIEVRVLDAHAVRTRTIPNL